MAATEACQVIATPQRGHQGERDGTKPRRLQHGDAAGLKTKSERTRGRARLKGGMAGRGDPVDFLAGPVRARRLLRVDATRSL